jgi:hypothetical protein
VDIEALHRPDEPDEDSVSHPFGPDCPWQDGEEPEETDEPDG